VPITVGHIFFIILLTGFMILNNPGMVWSQPSSLEKERFYQVRRELNDPSSFLYGNKTFSAYNAKNQKISETEDRWFNNRWRRISNTIYTYDQWGNNNFTEHEILNLETGELNFNYSQKNDYLDTLLIRSEFNIEFKESGTKEIEINIYDDLGRRITYQHLREEDSGEWSVRLAKYEFAESGCVQIQIDSNRSFWSGQYYFSYNKTIWSYLRDCKPLEKQFITWDEDLNQEILQETTKWEYIWDENNNLSRETSYRKEEEVDSTFNKIYEISYEYNDHGDPVLTEHLSFEGSNPLRRRILDSYDTERRVVFKQEQMWDSLSSAWETTWEWEKDYDDNGNLLLDAFRYYLDTLGLIYRYESIYFYDDKNQLIKNITDEEEKYPEDQAYSQTREHRYEYLCDGRLAEEVIEYTFSDRYQHDPQLISYTYYDKPVCESIQAETPVMTLFPNPAGAFIHFHFTEKLENPELYIFNSKGELIYYEQLNTTSYHSLDLNFLRSGVYLIRVVSSGGIYTGKFIKRTDIE